MIRKPHALHPVQIAGSVLLAPCDEPAQANPPAHPDISRPAWYPGSMSTAPILDREEYVEQAYFFRLFRDRMAENMPAQDVLERAHEEILSSTRLPYAIQFLSTEMKHTGLLADGFARLPHYFTPFQVFVVRQAEQEGSRFPMETALLVLEREAAYKSGTTTRPGLFVYQFEAIARNRLGYMEGIGAMAEDPHYDEVWKAYIDGVRRQVGVIDFSDIVYLRSELYVKEQRYRDPNYEPPVPPVYGEKEGKIARASRGRDPLYLFAALQRQLGYPEVPKYHPREERGVKLETILTKLRELDNRLRLAEGELRGSVDLSQFGKPDLLKDDDEK